MLVRISGETPSPSKQNIPMAPAAISSRIRPAAESFQAAGISLGGSTSPSVPVTWRSLNSHRHLAPPDRLRRPYPRPRRHPCSRRHPRPQTLVLTHRSGTKPAPRVKSMETSAYRSEPRSTGLENACRRGSTISWTGLRLWAASRTAGAAAVTGMAAPSGRRDRLGSWILAHESGSLRSKTMRHDQF